MSAQEEIAMTNETRIALVLGATGGIGGEVTRALLRRGWRVRALNRRAASLQMHEHRDGVDGETRDAVARGGIEWVQGDAMNSDDVREAAHGVSWIVHAVNPPKYHNWRALAVPMLDNTIAAARSSGAAILFPGTIYNYGPDAFPVLNERSPQRPLTRKGAIRVEMEQRLERASHDGVQTLIVRAGDFFGPAAGNNWFSQGLVQPGKPVKRVLYPGPREMGHAWAYLPDLAETMVRLIERRDDLARFDVFHFRGHWLPRGVEMAEQICRVAGLDYSRIRSFPWWAIKPAAPFVEMFRELLEMRYLWQAPVELDNHELLELIGTEPHTPLDEAVRATLIGIGSYQEPQAAAAV
jgi:nucleoside-diphosphate-sugar epimerase